MSQCPSMSEWLNKLCLHSHIELIEYLGNVKHQLYLQYLLFMTRKWIFGLPNGYLENPEILYLKDNLIVSLIWNFEG
jgi:hypothetical protein